MIAACALAAMTPFFALAVLAFTRPAAAVLAYHVPYRQTGTAQLLGKPARRAHLPGRERCAPATRCSRTWCPRVQLAFAYDFAARPRTVSTRAAG